MTSDGNETRDELQDRLQTAAGDITGDFQERDEEALSKLTPDQKAIQARARWELYDFVDAIWQAPHLREKGIHPNDVEGYAGVAALRDLLGILTSTADEAMGEDVHAARVKTVVERNE